MEESKNRLGTRFRIDWHLSVTDLLWIVPSLIIGIAGNMKDWLELETTIAFAGMLSGLGLMALVAFAISERKSGKLDLGRTFAALVVSGATVYWGAVCTFLLLQPS